jgi:mRNA interferase RelE/StbE
MAYTIELKKRVYKELEALTEENQQRILRDLSELLENPFKQGVIRLTGETSHRSRVGDYRIVFDVDGNTRVITVTKIAHRSEVYKD